MSGSSGPACRIGAKGSTAMAYAVSMGVSRRYGGRPSTAWYSVAPSDHRSEDGPGFWPRIRSGAMKSMEPTISPVCVSVDVPAVCAMPKSVRTTRPPAPSRTLPGLMSRCRTPAACAARTAAIMPRPIRAASSGGRVRPPLRKSPRVGAGTYSMTMQGRPSSSTTSCTTTTLGWTTRAALRASRRVRSYSVATSASDRCGCVWSCLSAICRASTSSSARHTVPMPPRPTRSTSRYRPATSRPSSDTAFSSALPSPLATQPCTLTDFVNIPAAAITGAGRAYGTRRIAVRSGAGRGAPPSTSVPPPARWRRHVARGRPGVVRPPSSPSRTAAPARAPVWRGRPR